MGARYEYVPIMEQREFHESSGCNSGGGEGQDIEGDVQYMSVDAFTEGRGIIF
ncbi:hypothetical protein [Peribacillus frigoritolerans]|uniref:hypothetical protein n=1 Tax=Peribacillus frigoritolerans TaxID=450367 RepID=UPI0023DA71F0|nr:hypothetical protein [Peribacillus frigoritolerans]MDF1997423.1 hypothetical protein [Peribacillus frigoritolerans]